MTYFQVIPSEDVKLGRNIKHDPRSLAYAFDGAGVTYQTVKHVRYVPVLDQGEVGSCTGNALVGAIGTAGLFEGLPKSVLKLDATADEKLAVDVYSAATGVDDFQGTYPPSDTGSDGLSVAKVAVSRGYISGYQHALTFNDALKALTLGPVLVGINWYSTFYQPDIDGVVHIGKRATIAGGHEIVADEINAEKQLVGFTNSWTSAWGKKGKFYITFADFERLLGENGDVTIPVAATIPAPTPEPVPPVVVNPLPVPVVSNSPEDVALAADIRKWLALKGL